MYYPVTNNCAFTPYFLSGRQLLTELHRGEAAEFHRHPNVDAPNYLATTAVLARAAACSTAGVGPGVALTFAEAEIRSRWVQWNARLRPDNGASL